MTELTQNILALDAEFKKALKTADISAQEIMKKADKDAAQMLEEEEDLLENQKKFDTAELDKKLKMHQHQLMEALEQKMKAYDNTMNIEILVEDLFSIAKDRVCH